MVIVSFIALQKQLAKNSTNFRAIRDSLHSIFFNVAKCTRSARANLQHLKNLVQEIPKSTQTRAIFCTNTVKQATASQD